jgi:hypothetical protein
MIAAEGPSEEFLSAVGLSRRARKKGRKNAPTCADCFFHQRMLCALDLDQPCSTFRRGGPDGLVAPRQPSLLPRSDERPAAA